MTVLYFKWASGQVGKSSGQVDSGATVKLDDEATHKKFLLVRTEESRQVKRNIDYYNLDMSGRREAVIYISKDWSPWYDGLK